MARIFISYSHANNSWATWLSWHLEQLGHSCYCQDWDARKNDSVLETINNEMERCDLFLAVFSQAYFSSPYCRKEINASIKYDVDRGTKRTGAVKIEDFSIPPIYSDIIHFDFTDTGEKEALIALKAGLLRDRTKPTEAPTFPTRELKVPRAKRSKGSLMASARAALMKWPLFSDKITTNLKTSQAPVPRFPNSPSGITPAFDDFLQALHKEQVRTKRADQRQKPGSRPSLSVRVPNFLLFRRSPTEIVLAICDASASVDPYALQRTNEPQIRSTLLESHLIPDIGFDTSFVHPMFYDDHDVVKRIFIDGILFFQFLYFPQSLIQVPTLRAGVESKILVSISAFVRTLLKFHGEHKVSFSRITTNQWPDRTLFEGLRQMNCFTRFAPTPSKGLHLGNVRSALLPYLMQRSDCHRNRFFLRYDDTNLDTVQERYISQIKEELDWLGFVIRPEGVFRQSNDKRKAMYEDVLLLLRHSSYVKTNPDGSLWLNWEHEDLQMAYWLDIHRGPIILHELPIGDRKRKLGGLCLAGIDGKLRYKLCGAIDDLFFHSHVIRDIRQESLTARQALIRYAIYRAWIDPDTNESTEAARRRIDAFRRSFLPAEIVHPLPFLAPPIYCHVANVVDENRQILKKRNFTDEMYDDSKKFSGLVDQCRKEQWLPETLMSFLLASVIPCPPTLSLEEHRIKMAESSGQLGVQALLDIVATQFSLDWLRSRRRNVSLSADALLRQERHVIRSLSYFNFVRHVEEFHALGGGKMPADSVMDRLYTFRTEAASWKEILLIAFAHPRRSEPIGVVDAYLRTLEGMEYGTDGGAIFRDRFRSNLGGAGSVKDAARAVRLALTGRREGMPIFLLGKILGRDGVAARCLGGPK